MILGQILTKPVKVCASNPLKQIVVESNLVFISRPLTQLNYVSVSWR